MVDMDELNAKGVLEIEAILKNARQVTTGLAQIREEANETSAAGDRLEKQSRSVEKGLERLGKSASSSAVGVKQASAAWDKQDRIYNDYLKHQERMTGSSATATAAIDRQTDSIIAQRYALYDVATTYGVISAVLLASAGYAVKVGADFESAFTAVERTSEGTVGQIEGLREALIEMSTQIPLTFQELSGIAALGNQLGIEAENIESFTGTIARFAAISGVSAEQVAESFGKLSNLTGLDPTQYENLGSAIAMVARSSASTEASILSTSKEIAALSTGAGFSAEAIVGLSGALASLSIAPEKSRGALSIYFSTLDKAVAAGGEKLENFATIVGVTSGELDRMVRDGEGQAVFQGFLEGLKDLDSVAKTTALNDLGLSAVRVDQTFKALSGNTDLVSASFAQSSGAMAEGTELARQYAIVVDDLNSRWMMFVNSLNALVEEISGGAVPGLAALVGQLTIATNAMRGFFSNEDTRRVAVFIGVLGASLGLFFAYRSAVALATASTYALTTAQAAMGASGTVGGIRGLVTALFGFRTAAAGAAGATTAAATGTRIFSSVAGASVVPMSAAATASNRLAFGLRAVGKATIIIGLLQFVTSLLVDFRGTAIGAADGLYTILTAAASVSAGIRGLAQNLVNALGPLGGLAQGLLDGAAGFDKGILNGAKGLQAWAKSLPTSKTEEFGGSVSNLGTGVSATTGDLGGFTEGLQNAGGAAGGAAKQIRTLVDYGNDLSQVFKRAFDIRFSGGQGLDAISSGWSTIRTSIEETNLQIDEYRATMMSLTADKAIKEYWLSVAENYGDVLRAGELRAELAELDNDLSKTTKSLTKAQDKNTKTLVGNTDGAIENRAEILKLVTDYQGYITALASSGMSQDQLRAKTAQLKADFIAQATQLGYNEAELQTYAVAFDDVALAIARLPRNVTIEFNGNPAMTAINEFLAQARAAVAGGIGNIPAPTILAPIVQVPRIIIDPSDVRLYRAGLEKGQITAKQYHEYLYGFQSGGYTGGGGVRDIAGVVHGKEFVFSAPAVKNIGVGNLAYAHKMALGGGGSASIPSASGGSAGSGGVQTVQLSARDRQIMLDTTAAVRQSMTIPVAALQNVVASGNVNSSTRRDS